MRPYLVFQALILSACAPALAWGERSYGAINTSEPRSFTVRIQTEVTIPASGPACTQVRIWHAVPPWKPWTQTAAPLGASDLRSAPTAKLEPETDGRSTHFFYANDRRFAAGEKVQLVTSFKVNSVKRSFNPSTSRTDWYRVQNQVSKATAPSNAEIRALAESLKGTHDPASTVVQFCQWIYTNIKYDAQVDYGNEDVRAILAHKRGHCGHMGVLLQQMCNAVGLNTRPALGMILEKPMGKLASADTPNDLGNIHTWAEVELPGTGWIEVDPAAGDKCFVIPANYVQNNTSFQNASVWVKEEKQPTRPITWSYSGGKAKCDYNVLTRITYTADR